MSTIENQLERNARERKELKNRQSIEGITNALAKGDNVALLKACRSFVSRNQKKAVKKTVKKE